MIGSPVFTRAGVVAALLLLGGILLALPGTTQEPSIQKANPAVRLPETPAASMGDAAPVEAHTATEPRGPSEPTAHQRPAMAGMVVGIDPETGELGMPTPDQLKRLSESQQYEVDHSAAGLVEVHHPDGSVSIDLQGRFQEYATVRIGPGGKLIFDCVDGEENAKRVLQGSAPGQSGSATPNDAAAPVTTAPEER